MSKLDIIHYANKILQQTIKLPGNYNLPLPVKRIRALCNAALGAGVELEALPPLTDVEASVLQAIKADFQEGKQPTTRSVQERLGYDSHTSVAVVVTRLIKHGYLKREGSKKQIVVIAQP